MVIWGNILSEQQEKGATKSKCQIRGKMYDFNIPGNFTRGCYLSKATVILVQGENNLFTTSYYLLLFSDKDGQIKDIHQAELIPTQPTQLSFWNKFWELQFKMILSSPSKEMEHKYSSSPIDWPFMMKNVAYWMNGNTNVSKTF